MQRVIFILVAFVCFSCRCDEETYYLSDDLVALFPYENITSASFISNNENVVVFENIRYERDIYEENSPSGMWALGPKCDDSFEEISVSMRSSSNYDVFTGTSSGFKTTIVDYNVSNFGMYYDLEESDFIDNYSFNGATYNDVLRIYSIYHDSEIILVENIGIISIRFGNQSLILEN